MVSTERGFTIVELLVAITVLSVGLLSFLGTSALITRMLARGDRAATATFYAQERIERLQGQPCATMANGSEMRGGNFRVDWTITPMGGSDRARVIVRYAAGPTTMREDTLETSVLCIR